MQISNIDEISVGMVAFYRHLNLSKGKYGGTANDAFRQK
jgi:hypothetical protein